MHQRAKPKGFGLYYRPFQAHIKLCSGFALDDRRLLAGRAPVGQGITVYHIRGDCQVETGAQSRSEEQVGFRRLQELSLFKGLEVIDLRVYTMGFS